MARLIDPDTPLADLAGSSLLAEGTTWNGVGVRFALRVEPTLGGRCRLRADLLDVLAPRAEVSRQGAVFDPDGAAEVLPGATPLRYAVQGVAEVDLIRAMPADVARPLHRSIKVAAFALLIAVGLIGIVVAFPMERTVWQFLLMAGGMLTAATGAILGARQFGEGDPRLRILAGGKPVRRADEGALLAHASAGPTPAERVDVVQAAYGGLLGDIVYRIENSALFDAAVPQTQRFQIALVNWDADAPDAAALAAEVEESFAAACAHAEELGLDHLPQTAREPARRAVKAAITARASADAEREAAATAAAGLVAGLSLYYLPVIDPGTPSLVAARRELDR